MMSDAFSAIITVGVKVLPLVTTGITEASTTLKLLIPFTLKNKQEESYTAIFKCYIQLVCTAYVLKKINTIC